MIDFILKVLHGLPHLNFKFKFIEKAFSIDWRSEYVQSLIIFAGIAGIVALLLLLTIVITWVCQCCSREDTTVKSRRKVRRLSTALFVLSVICFFLLGFCMFGNEHINRGVTSSITGLSDVAHGFRLAIAQSSSLNESCRNASRHIEALEKTVHEKSPGANETLVKEVDVLLTKLSDDVDSIIKYLNSGAEILGGVSFLENAKAYGDRIELERWMLCVTLLSIMIVVLFAGVIAFCRQSKKGAVVFSGLGIVIFVVGWILFVFVFPASIALADFCTEGGEFVQSRLSPQLIATLEFYKSCDARPTHDNVPPSLPVGNASDLLSTLDTTRSKLDGALDAAFNSSAELHNQSRLIADDITRSLKSVGALESTVACYAYRDDVVALHQGTCQQAVLGSAILILALLLFSLFLFILLIVVSKSWNLFTRLPSDYVEVGDDDPFFPRANDSTIPVDIYGTHVFNPRTRERAEPSTGTTTATVGNGAPEEQPLWSRSIPSAPANNTSSLSRSPYDDRPYRNYHVDS